MIDCARFHAMLLQRGLDFFTGVPDSLLKDLCAWITDHAPAGRHVIAANEGGAVALAMGHYLAERAPALVYMQNSGLGNALNPLVSLADREVCGIPMLLVIGWRGEPGHPDEPQHAKQGRITLALLEAMGIPHRILDARTEAPETLLDELCRLMASLEQPVALVVREGAFAPGPSRGGAPFGPALTREAAIAIVAAGLDPGDVVVATTGKASRELYEYRERGRAGHRQDFLTVGGMGHASQIALGIALSRPSRQVICLDGDGAALMHLGAFAINATQGPLPFKHIILNNGCHDSVGGQATAGWRVSLAGVARECGYRMARVVDDPADLRLAVQELRQAPGPALLEIRVRPGARPDLGRPGTSPQENKREFMTGLI